MPSYLLTSSYEMIKIFYIHSTDDDFWNNLVTMTWRRAEQVRASKPNSYYATYMKADLTVEEMKAFLGVRLNMEYFLVKRTYASYWRSDGKFSFRDSRLPRCLRKRPLLGVSVFSPSHEWARQQCRQDWQNLQGLWVFFFLDTAV